MNAKSDLAMYQQAMMDGNGDLALRIEERYGLDGYPPSVVSAALLAAAEGKDIGEAIDAMLGCERPC